MPLIQDFEGAGRIRLSNGARMSQTSFKEAMREIMSHTDAPDQQDRYLDEVIEDVKRLQGKLSRLEKTVYLRRAERDKSSGRLQSETEPTVTHHSSEGDIWK